MHALIQCRARLAIALLTFTLVAAATPTLTADVYPRQAGIRILSYAFDITLNDANDEFVVIDTGARAREPQQRAPVWQADVASAVGNRREIYLLAGFGAAPTEHAGV